MLKWSIGFVASLDVGVGVGVATAALARNLLRWLDVGVADAGAGVVERLQWQRVSSPSLRRAGRRGRRRRHRVAGWIVIATAEICLADGWLSSSSPGIRLNARKLHRVDSHPEQHRILHLVAGSTFRPYSFGHSVGVIVLCRVI